MSGDPRSPASRSAGERDRDEAIRFVTYCREICRRRGKHTLEHGQFRPEIMSYVARCHVCDYTQTIERGGDDKSPAGRAIKRLAENGRPGSDGDLRRK